MIEEAAGLPCPQPRIEPVERNQLVMAVVFHTAVSGLPLESPRYRYVDAGPDWATGGDWGPEGGIPAGLGMGTGAALVYLLSRRRRLESVIPKEPSPVVSEEPTSVIPKERSD